MNTVNTILKVVLDFLATVKITKILGVGEGPYLCSEGLGGASLEIAENLL